MRTLFACMLITIFAAPLFADMGPKPRTTGAGMVPQTDMKGVEIEMTREEVDLVLSKGDDDDSLDVTVTFHMTNLGKEAAFEVGFPVGAFKNMTEFSVTTDGVDREAKLIDKNPQPADSKDEMWNHDYWWVWDESWGEKAEVTHVVKYHLNIWHWSYYRHTGYILHTGAAWKNVIKQATVTLSFAGDMQMGNIERVGPAGCEFKDGKIVWSFKDLEPTQKDDISISYNRKQTVEQKAALLKEESAKYWSSRKELVYLCKSAPGRFGRTEFTPEENAALRDALANLITEAKEEGDKLVMPSEQPAKIEFGDDTPEELRRILEKELGNETRDYARKGEAFKLLESFAEVVRVASEMPDDAAAVEMLSAWDKLVSKCLDGNLFAGVTKLVPDDKQIDKLKALREEAGKLGATKREENPRD